MKKSDDLPKPIVLNNGDVIEFDSMTDNYGRAEFGFCPSMFRGKMLGVLFVGFSKSKSPIYTSRPSTAGNTKPLESATPERISASTQWGLGASCLVQVTASCWSIMYATE